MRNILEDLYYGNISPYDKRIAANSELRCLVGCVADCEDQLTERLNDKGQKILKRLISAQHEIDDITAKEFFILGFRLGVRLVTECMEENDGALMDRG